MLDFLIAEAKPSDRSRIGRIPGLLQLFHPRIHARFALAEHLLCFLRSKRVGDVAEINRPYNFFRIHVRKQLPERLAFYASVEVPDRVNERASGQMNDALLRAEPAELAVRSQLAIKRAEVVCKC